MSELISILTPSYEQGRFIAEAVESVRTQRDDHYEHIIMDGGSTDETKQVLAGYGRDPRLRWRSEPDRGQSHALNKALAEAGGRIVGWINSDDGYLPGAFAAVRKAFAADRDALVVYGNYRDIDVESRPLAEHRAYETGVISILAFWRSNYRIGQPAVFWRRALSDQLGPIDEGLHYVMDWEYWVRARARCAFVHVDETLACFRRHDLAKSASEHRCWAEMLARVPQLLDLAPRHLRPSIAAEAAFSQAVLALVRQGPAEADALLADGWPERPALSAAAAAVVLHAAVPVGLGRSGQEWHEFDRQIDPPLREWLARVERRYATAGWADQVFTLLAAHRADSHAVAEQILSRVRGEPVDGPVVVYGYGRNGRLLVKKLLASGDRTPDDILIIDDAAQPGQCVGDAELSAVRHTSPDNLPPGALVLVTSLDDESICRRLAEAGVARDRLVRWSRIASGMTHTAAPAAPTLTS